MPGTVGGPGGAATPLTVLWDGEVDAVGRRLKGERRVGCGAVDVVALDALVEHAAAGAQNGLAVSVEIEREADTGLDGHVVVLTMPRGNPFCAGEFDAVEVVGNGCAGGLAEARSGWIEVAGSRWEPVPGPREKSAGTKLATRCFSHRRAAEHRSATPMFRVRRGSTCQLSIP